MDVPLEDSKMYDPDVEKSEAQAASKGCEPFDPAAMQRLLEMVAYGLLDRPEEVSITVKRQAGEVTLVMHIPADEICKIIGDRGRTVRSLRTFFSALSARHDCRILLEIVET